MKIYTKTGDLGTTSLFGGQRVSKDHIRIETYGTIDELNSYIGLIRDQNISENHIKSLLEIQDRLFTIGAILATPQDKTLTKNGKPRHQNLGIIQEDIIFLENQIDQMEQNLSQMTNFVLPGGHTYVSYCHIARCICRRSERLAVHLHHQEPIEPLVLTYLNRLSDFLFVLARKLTAELNATEIKWIPRNT